MFGDVWGCLGMFGDVWGCLGMFGDVWGCLGVCTLATSPFAAAVHRISG
jgi:hypothetical protein